MGRPVLKYCRAVQSNPRVKCYDESADRCGKENVRMKEKRCQQIKSEGDGTASQYHGPMRVATIKNFRKTIKNAA